MWAAGTCGVQRDEPEEEGRRSSGRTVACGAASGPGAAGRRHGGGRRAEQQADVWLQHGGKRTISEVKRTRGGLSGYCSVNVIRIEKMPPSNGVSSGPTIVAPHTIRLSSPRGLALTPSGGDCFIALRSDIRRSDEADIADSGEGKPKLRANVERARRA